MFRWIRLRLFMRWEAQDDETMLFATRNGGDHISAHLAAYRQRAHLDQGGVRMKTIRRNALQVAYSRIYSVDCGFEQKLRLRSVVRWLHTRNHGQKYARAVSA